MEIHVEVDVDYNIKSGDKIRVKCPCSLIPEHDLVIHMNVQSQRKAKARLLGIHSARTGLPKEEF